MNYSKEQTQYIIAEYEKNPCRDTVNSLAVKLERSPKSIIGKLSREGVYRREEYATKTGEKPITKLELIAIIADALELEIEELSGLEKTPKSVLKLLTKVVAGFEEEQFVTTQLEIVRTELGNN